MKKIDEKEIHVFLGLYTKYNSLRKVSTITKHSVNTIKKYLSFKTKVHQLTSVKNVDISDQRLLGVYIGLWMGDGTQYWDASDRSYIVKICSNKDNTELNLFIQDVIYRIFHKKSWLIFEKETKKAYIKLKSKFIFDFISDYAAFDNNKTLTVQLKSPVISYSNEFLKGVLLGVALSDGYLKNRFILNVTSPGLSEHTFQILSRFNFSPKKYLTLREDKGWNTLYTVYLTSSESLELLHLLDQTLKEIYSEYSFSKLKYNSAT